tara:strand:- start:48 stop:734 length:687 start_codon:yes stop_codon:yes gene_type:complete
MTELLEDKFVTKLIGFKSYIAYKKILIKTLYNIKKPFFLTIKSKKKIVFSSSFKNIKINLVSNLIYFERNFKKKQEMYIKCRYAKKQDIKQIVNIARENNLNSRFVMDKLIPEKFKKRYRSEWVKNFFRKQRGDYLIVADLDKRILGFVLILKKKNQLNIDLVASGKKFRKKGVATSLINYINNEIMKKTDKIIAGTQINNFGAIKMYKKLGFRKKKGVTFCYHIHGR